MNFKGILKYGKSLVGDFKISNKDFKKALCFFLLIFVSILVSVFWEYAVFIALAISCLAMFFIKGGNKFYLLTMLLPFYHIFRFGYDDLVLSSYVLVFSILILGVEFLIDLIKHRKKINWTVSCLFLVVIIYAVLPIGAYNWNNIFRFIITIISIYLSFVFKDDINLKELFLSLMVGLFLAILITSLRNVSERLEIFLPDHYEPGFDKPRFAGLTADPNYFSVEIILLLAIMSQLYLKGSFNFAFMFVYIFFGYFGFRSLSKSYILIFLLLFLIVSTLIIIKTIKDPSRNNKIKMISWFVANVLLCLLSIKVISCLLNRFIEDRSVNFQAGSTVLFISMSLMMLLEISTLKGLGSINSLTTGRSELWIIYLQEIVSTPKNLILGHGIGSNIVETNFGYTSAHNFYIETLYHLGLLGAIFLLTIIIYLFVKTSNRQNRNFVNFLPTICTAGMLFSLNSLISYRPYLLVIILAFSLNHNNNAIVDDIKNEDSEINNKKSGNYCL